MLMNSNCYAINRMRKSEVQSMAWTSFIFTPLIEPCIGASLNNTQPRPYVFSKIIPSTKLHTEHESAARPVPFPQHRAR
jgi:hypothetical protein